MKRMVKTFIVLLILCVIPVNAKSNIKELIPLNTKTSIYTENFAYKELYCNQEAIYFNGIRNLTDKDLPISISIGLFDRNGKNVGVVNFCDHHLNANQEMSYYIDIKKDYLGSHMTTDNIRYIAVLSDNITCLRTGGQEFIGQSVDQMGISHKDSFKSGMSMTIKVLIGIGIAIIFAFFYKILFAKQFINIDTPTKEEKEESNEREEQEKAKEEIKEKPKEEKFKFEDEKFKFEDNK